MSPSMTIVLRASMIERVRVADDVRGHDGILGVDLEDAAIGPSAAASEGAVDLVDGDVPVQMSHEVDDRAVGHRHAQATSRRACPSRLGMTCPTARAAPVVVGMMFCGRGARAAQVLVQARPGCAGRWCRRARSSSGRARCRRCRAAPWPRAPGSWWCRTRWRRCGARPSGRRR